jgi:hypothetical protein
VGSGGELYWWSILTLHVTDMFTVRRSEGRGVDA